MDGGRKRGWEEEAEGGRRNKGRGGWEGRRMREGGKAVAEIKHNKMKSNRK